ncbi:MAG TPA: IPT/TIG domain-containing protein, partial [Candidatus Hydrogenedentes bacterium]|nr:IPT/TIG domain-containing protein [Candidatus Hydrogenedentota bacterium]
PSKITQGGPPMPFIGIDVSTNGASKTVDSGTSGGSGADKAFIVAGRNWAANAHKGCFLIDSRYEAYEILGNTNNKLTLRSGRPRDGAWRIVQDPSFLEQVIVEFYTGSNQTAGEGEGEGEGEVWPSDFNLSRDLLPLSIDPTVSGVAIYRDNDLDPRNRNGIFDADIDIPVALDAPPTLVGLSGQPETQVKFLFCQPGTDDWPQSLASQPRNRQWVPDTFGIRSGAAEEGPDFFVVVRASSRIPEDETFAAAIVSWGPNTPTEPDPDSFLVTGAPARPTDEAALFSEFPWASRGLGFITFFQNPPVNYYLEGGKARQEPDASGFNWLRSSTSRKFKTRLVTAQKPLIGPYSLVIDSVTQSRLPSVITPPATFDLVIKGTGFGSAPMVSIGGYAVTVKSADNTSIAVSLRNVAGLTPVNPAVLIVRNTVTGDERSRDDLFYVEETAAQTGPRITNVVPARGSRAVFPVTIYGRNFTNINDLEVLFGETRMPIESATSTMIRVGFPVSGFPATGPMDVTVRNLEPNSLKGLEAVATNAFYYVDNPHGPCFIATAAYGTPLERRLDVFRAFRDEALLGTFAGSALVEGYYAASPALADVVARHAALAGAVRCVLTPLAWAMAHPWPAMMLLAVGAGGCVLRRRRRTL